MNLLYWPNATVPYVYDTYYTQITENTQEGRL